VVKEFLVNLIASYDVNFSFTGLTASRNVGFSQPPRRFYFPGKRFFPTDKSSIPCRAFGLFIRRPFLCRIHLRFFRKTGTPPLRSSRPTGERFFPFWTLWRSAFSPQRGVQRRLVSRAAAVFSLPGLLRRRRPRCHEGGFFFFFSSPDTAFVPRFSLDHLLFSSYLLTFFFLSLLFFSLLSPLFALTAAILSQ